ncbi:bifunctional adenosylcobinamide kinase/adenosylcobinamide-phosphate guanylyltransferase [Cytobacillus sp. NCCP-133]|uniref:bifunctional adenosylcobinamide kinase/adenosylcobinamide-phosphate guanylyltransferase n=1 Tax=Cytobacillus sp. NCCP-133 TaxID=766848 RepID=UPI00222E132F|nr:bifunctional adenosylcobinamide kinase/adenosylcobinamide-phosphate guanylyltransferase [Cytobacillus sp. NCCP-133]GLB60954.1 hypothetical protein NCCP133_30860 [Cytobacillus sp. NCCP-133]
MHFVTGGAFNGKSKWVKDFYRLEEVQYQWISAYKGKVNMDTDQNSADIHILEGVELWIRGLAKEFNTDEVRTRWKNQLRFWLGWEKEDIHRRVILIGSDISKGIVPVEAADRYWRDVTGWAYQDTAAAADRIDLIWYGISQKIK